MCTRVYGLNSANRWSTRGSGVHDKGGSTYPPHPARSLLPRRRRPSPISPGVYVLAYLFQLDIDWYESDYHSLGRACNEFLAPTDVPLIEDDMRQLGIVEVGNAAAVLCDHIRHLRETVRRD